MNDMLWSFLLAFTSAVSGMVLYLAVESCRATKMKQAKLAFT